VSSTTTDSLKGGAAGPLLLTGLGLGYIIVGEYLGGGYALASAGAGGLVIALVTATLMFACLIRCVSDFMRVMPSTGGAHQFITEGLGLKIGHLAGAAILLEYICGTAVLGSVLALYVGAHLGTGPLVTVICLFALVSLVHIWGVGEALWLTLLAAFIAVVGLVVFFAGAVPHVDMHRLLDVAPVDGNSLWFPFGWTGVWSALPFAVTFYVTIEGVVFASAEAINPEKNIPLAMYLTLAIVALFASGVVLVGPAVGGAKLIAGSPQPLSTAAQAIGASDGAWIARVVDGAAIAALAAGFFGGMYATSRLLFQLGHEGLLPGLFAKTNRRHSPWFAILAAAVLGVLVCAVGNVQQLIVIFVFGATVVYVLLFVAHWRMPRLTGMAPSIGFIAAILIFVACFLADPTWSLSGAALSVVAAAYFYFKEVRVRRAASMPLATD
jgi:ethanolamine permease